MNHETYLLVLRVKRILRGMMKRGVVYDFAANHDGVLIKFTPEMNFVYYTLSGFLKALRKGLIDVHAEVYRR